MSPSVAPSCLTLHHEATPSRVRLDDRRLVEGLVRAAPGTTVGGKNGAPIGAPFSQWPGRESNRRHKSCDGALLLTITGFVAASVAARGARRVDLRIALQGSAL